MTSENVTSRRPLHKTGLGRAAWFGFGVAALFALAFSCARLLGHRQRAILDDQTNASRLITYALGPGESLRLPVPPGTDVVRVVFHVFRHGPLGESAHRTLWRAGTRPPLEVMAPGSTGRASAEESGLTVGDPVGFNLDAGAHPNDLELALDSVTDAEGVLVRVYRREALQTSEERERRDTISFSKRERLANRAGELGWVDLAGEDRSTLIGARWRKVAPLPSERQPFRELAINLSPKVPPVRAELTQVQSSSLSPGETLGGTVSGPNRLVIRAGDASAKLTLLARGATSTARDLSGIGELELGVVRGQTTDFRVTADSGTTLSFLAADSKRVQLSTAVEYDRITLDRPAVVKALDAAIVLRVQARRPLPGGPASPSSLHLLVEVSGDGHPVTSKVELPLARAVRDRYDSVDERRSPSELTTFYVLIPRRGQAMVSVAEAEADLLLSELDPQAEQRRFVRRRPTNWADFAVSGRVTLRMGRGDAQPSAPMRTHSELKRVVLPHVAGLRRHDGQTFVPASAAIPFEVKAGISSPLFLRLLPGLATDVHIAIDGGLPRRRAAGVVSEITTGRIVHADGETKVRLALGDDLQPGRHLLSFRVDQSSCDVHLPWQKPMKAPRETAWLVGDFEP